MCPKYCIACWKFKFTLTSCIFIYYIWQSYLPICYTHSSIFILIKTLWQLSAEFRIKFKLFTKVFWVLGWRRSGRAHCSPFQTLSPSGFSHRRHLFSLQIPKLIPTSGPLYLLSPLPGTLSPFVLHIIQITAQRDPQPTSWSSILQHAQALCHITQSFSSEPSIQAKNIY